MADWFSENAPPKPAAAPGGGDWFAKNAPPGTAAEKPGAVERFVEGTGIPGALKSFTSGGALQTAGKLLFPTVATPAMLKDAYEAVKSMASASSMHVKASTDFENKGDYVSALGHALYAVPGIGEFGYQIANKFNDGDVAGGLGGLAALFGPKILKGVAPLASKAATAVSESAPVTAARGAMAGALGAVPEMVDKLPIIKAAAPVVKGMRSGAQTALDARAAQIAENEAAAARAAAPQRVPLWKQNADSLADMAEPAPAETITPEAARALAAEKLQASIEARRPPPPEPRPARVPIHQDPAILARIRSDGGAAPITNLADMTGDLTPTDLEAARAQLAANRARRAATDPRGAVQSIERLKALSEEPPTVEAPPAPTPTPATAAAVEPPAAAAPAAAPEAPTTLAEVATDPDKVYRNAKRAVKIQKVFDHLTEKGFGPEDVSLISKRQWSAVAQSAGVNELEPHQIDEVVRRFGLQTAEKPPILPAEDVARGTERQVSGENRQGAEVPQSSPAVQRPAPSQDPSRTSVLIPGERQSIPARYEVRELGDVRSSHNGHTFLANPEYELENERDYSKPENQQRVVTNSAEGSFDPRYHITDNPDASNGPIVVDQNGNAIGGNSRGMILQRVYGRGAQGAADYRDLLERKASQFGIDPETFKGMKEPVLVRRVSGEDLEAIPGGAKWAIRKTNVSGTAALSGAERAIADAGQMPQHMVEHIGNAIDAEGPGATLNDALSGQAGTKIANRLISEGFFNEQERPAIMDGKTGALTQVAKDRISKALTGRFFRDADQFDRTPAALKQKLERVAAPLAKVSSDPKWDITPKVKEAVDLLEYGRAHDIKNLADLTAQTSMFEDAGAHQWSQDSITLANALRDMKPNELVGAMRKYANSKEPTMFGESTPAEAFADSFTEAPAPPAAAAAPPKSKMRQEKTK